MSEQQTENNADDGKSVLTAGLETGSLWPWVAELGSALKEVERIAAKGGAYGLASKARKLSNTLISASSEKDCICACDKSKMLDR